MRRIAGSYNKYMFDFISGGNFLYFSQQCLRVPVTDTGGGVVGCGCVQCQAAARATGSGHGRAHGEEGPGGEGCCPAIRLVGSHCPLCLPKLGAFLEATSQPQQIPFVASLTKF